MQSIALHPVQVSLPITINLVSLTRRWLATSHGLYFVSINRVALVPGHDGVGAAVADVLPNDVPERSGHHQGRRDGRREQGEPHGRVAAPAALPRLLRPSKLATCMHGLIAVTYPVFYRFCLLNAEHYAYVMCRAATRLFCCLAWNKTLSRT